MTTTISYFENRLTVETLGTEADSFGRFRNRDDRGEVAMLLAGTRVDHIEFAEFNDAGIKRGFHFHNEYHEKFYVISGSLTVSATHLESGENRIFNIKSGDIMTIAPGIAHAFLSLEKSHVLSMGTGAAPFIDRQIYRDISFHALEPQ